MIRRRTLWRRLLVVALLILSLALFTVFFREQASGALHGAQDVGARILAPLQSASSKAIQPFRDAWNWVGDLFGAKSENERLRKEVVKLRQATARELSTQAENANLRELLGLRDDPIFSEAAAMIPARVVSSSTDVWYSTVTINAGSDAGVELHAPVVNGEGLVGRVTAVTANAAEVTLITDQASFVDAEVEPGGVQGVVAGSVRGNVSLLYVDKSAKVKAGQFVVTSGRSGSIFAHGILVGVVENVGKQDVELYQTVTVRPVVDFRKLEYVMVVRR